MIVCDFQGLVLKDYVASALLCWSTCSRGSQLPCHKDTQANSLESAIGKDRTPPANNQHQLAIHVREPTWKPQTQLSLQMNLGLADILTATSWETSSQT